MPATRRDPKSKIATTAAALDVSRTSVYRHLPEAGSAHHSAGGR